MSASVYWLISSRCRSQWIVNFNFDGLYAAMTDTIRPGKSYQC